MFEMLVDFQELTCIIFFRLFSILQAAQNDETLIIVTPY
jgi:hypothetical protein